MIQYPAEHYFVAKLPELEYDELELWYKHPVYPLKCNQIGVLDFGETEYQYNRKRDNFVLYREDLSIGSRPKLAYECYHNCVLLNNRMYFQDGNPLNNCFLNLVTDPSNEHRKQLFDTQQAFWIKSIDYMKAKSKKLESKGIDPDNYWNLMSLPKAVTKRWDDYKKGKEQKFAFSKGEYITNESKEQLKMLISEMHNKGLENKHIAQELNMTRQYIAQFRRRNGI